MLLLKRLPLAACLSACSESAIAQETPQPAQHKEAWWDSPWGEQDRLGNVNNLSADGVKKAAGWLWRLARSMRWAFRLRLKARRMARESTRSSGRRGRTRIHPQRLAAG